MPQSELQCVEDGILNLFGSIGRGLSALFSGSEPMTQQPVDSRQRVSVPRGNVNVTRTTQRVRDVNINVTNYYGPVYVDNRQTSRRSKRRGHNNKVIPCVYDS